MHVCRCLDRSKYVLFSSAAPQSRCCLAEFVMQFGIILPVRVQDMCLSLVETPWEKNWTRRCFHFNLAHPYQVLRVGPSCVPRWKTSGLPHARSPSIRISMEVRWCYKRFQPIRVGITQTPTTHLPGEAGYFLNMSARTGETGREVTGRVGYPHPKTSECCLLTVSFSYRFYTVKQLRARGFELLWKAWVP